MVIEMKKALDKIFTQLKEKLIKNINDNNLNKKQ